MNRRRFFPLLLTAGILLFGCRILGPDLIFTPTELPAAALEQPYRATIVVSENNTPVGDMYIESGTLPAGLTFTFLESTDSAEISGTPTETGVFEFTVGAWCYGTNVSGDQGQQHYTLVVE